MQTPSDAGNCGAELAVSASGNSVSNGTVVFSNSNNVSFGMSGSTVTASAGVAGGGIALSASASSISSGTAVFSNSNNVSFGLNGSTVTASASLSQSTAPGAIAAGTQTATSGTIIFSNLNNVTFGMAGNQTVTASASYSQSTSPGAIAAGTQTATSGTIVFSNSNGVTFGMSGSTQVTASYSQSSAQVSSWVAGQAPASAELNPGVSIRVAHVTLPAYITVTQALMRVEINGNSTATDGTAVTLAVALYTLSGGTASLATSGGRTLTWVSGNTNSTSVYAGASGLRWRTIPFNATLTPGDYLIAISMSSATNVTLSVPVVSDQSGAGSYDGVENTNWLGGGILTVTSAAFPASIAASDSAGYLRTGADANRRPTVTFFGTF
jgi:hypothetical protein